MSKSQISNPGKGNVEAIMNREFGDGPERQAELRQIEQDMAVGRQVYAARRQAGLTQRQLAELVGTTQSVISQLESADYEGHTLSMLRRIGEALNRRVEVRFAEAEREAGELATA